MALPGLNLDALKVPLQEKQTVIHDLKANSEWRFEVAFDQTIEVKLRSGTAEIFGTELALNRVEPYVFQGAKAAIFTWHGCKLEVTGSCLVDYTAEETPMVSYVNTHFALDSIRDEAAANKTLGPRVLIVGPDNAGKTSLVKILAAYAYRSGRIPTVANLDPKEGFLTIPGTISASALESITDVTEGWGSSPITGPSQIPVKLPLVYSYGLEDPDTKPQTFKAIVRRLGLSLLNRLEDDTNTKATGCIIDTAGSTSTGKNNYDLMQHIISEFQISVLITLGSERLYSDMSRRFASKPGSGIKVLKLDKSGGCVDRDASFLEQMRTAQVRQYFFGSPRATLLSPHSQTIPFDELTIYRIPLSTDQSTDDPSLLPGADHTSSDDDDDIYNPSSTQHPSSLTGTNPNGGIQALELLPTPTPYMHHALLALVNAKPTDSIETVRDASVIGFVFVNDVDDKRRKVRVLAPMSGRLPKRVLVWSRWPEVSGAAVMG